MDRVTNMICWWLLRTLCFFLVTSFLLTSIPATYKSGRHRRGVVRQDIIKGGETLQLEHLINSGMGKAWVYPD
jgi:hypothetical protein